MPTVLLVRHGRTAANASGQLAGWTPGVLLDDTGRQQAAAVAQRLAALPIARIVASPLERCQETAAAIVAARKGEGQLLTDERLGEAHYGDWTGKDLKVLAKDPLWPVVQGHPSAVTFPGDAGESMLAMQTRAVQAVRAHDAAVAADVGDHGVWVAVSHGDVIKSVLADALGMHLDAFQRIAVDPCSVSVVRYTPMRPFVLRSNDVGGDLAGVVPPPPKRRRSRSTRARAADSDAVVGGGAGS
ncbi:MAG: MSMEG_4193 family putative phosphomutase [Actinomycetes bacterium]